MSKLIMRFCILIAFYFASLTLVFSYDSPRLQANCLDDSAILVDENMNEWKRSTGMYGTSIVSDIDAFTDALMLTRNVRLEPEQVSFFTQSVQSRFGFPSTTNEAINKNPFKRAVYMNGYSRYWHGYNIVLRPLLACFDYVGIRYLFLFVFTLLTFAVFEKLQCDIGRVGAYLFVLGLILCKYPVMAMCLQYLNMYILMLVALLYIGYIFLPKYKYIIMENNYESLSLFCLTIGSLTCFFDLLTTPLLPICMCLSYLIIYYQRVYNYVFSKWTCIKCFIIWSCGYLGTWLTKWILYYLVCNDNILVACFKHILHRTSENALGDYGDVIEVKSIYAISSNIFTLIMPLLPTAGIVLVSILVVIIILLARKYRNTKANMKLQEQLIIMAMLPYVWYAAIANHSQLHFWFTYRTQMITIFCLGYYFYSLLDWHKLVHTQKD